MDFRFFKTQAGVFLEGPPSSSLGSDPDFVLICLENTLDPDALNHTGFNYYGAYGDGSTIDTWSSAQPLEVISKDELPDPITFFPAPFNQA
jgi:hypothetical protein